MFSVFLSWIYNVWERIADSFLYVDTKKISLSLTKSDHTSKVNNDKPWLGQEFTRLSGTWRALETGYFHRMLSLA